MNKLIIVVCLLLAVNSQSMFGQNFLKVNGTKIVNPKGDEVILRGMGLGGWMLQEGYMLRVQNGGQQQHAIRNAIEQLVGEGKTEDFYNHWQANHFRRIDVDSMARWGFNSIRLPMHYNLYTLPVEKEPVAGQNTWLDKGFAMTDSLLRWCAANKIYLILDMHATPGGQGNDVNISDRDPSRPSLWESADNQNKLIALWHKLAKRYASEPWIGGYDIINEPNWGFEKVTDRNGCAENTNAPLRDLMIRITKAIREVDQNHIVIIEGNCWGNNYRGVFPPWDTNTVVSFHKYWNYNDEASVKGFIDVRNQYQVPVWVGESGENSNLWYRDAIHLLESHSIGWAWWPLKKLGFNNPLQIVTPPDYEKVLEYWNKNADKPDATEASRAFEQLAENAKLEKCIYHPDVVDAMFRQVHTDETRPYHPNRVSAGASIMAVDYDMGRNRMAYFDMDTANYYISAGGDRTPWNQGHVYRNDGVDIGTEKDGQSFYVDHFDTGEWLEYTINVVATGKVNVSISVASTVHDGSVSFTVDGNTASHPVPYTNGTTNWTKVNVGRFNLKAGKHVIRVKASKGGFTFKSLSFS